MGKIEVKEFDEKIEDVCRDFNGFSPLACMECESEAEFEVKLFLLSREPRSEAEENAVNQELKKFGFSSHSILGGEKCLALAAKCSKCGSEEIFWDF